MTDIEGSVLQLITDGATIRTVASKLGLSVHEVRRVLEALWRTMDGDPHGQMDEARLLAHLRSEHELRRRRARELEDLRRLHLGMHALRQRVEERSLGQEPIDTP